MFDYVRCEYPLPGDPPAGVEAIDFQTKDFDCQMDSYRITKDGELWTEGKPYDWTGDVVFYHSNVVTSGPGTYTKDGEDSMWLEYQAIFVRGTMTHLELLHYETSPSMKSSLHWYPPQGFKDEEERKQWWAEKRKEFDDYVKAELERRASKTEAK